MAKRGKGLEPKFCEDANDYLRTMMEMQSGHDPEPRRLAPGPTRTTSQPYTETAQRKPFMPVQDISTPGLDEGVSFRQKL